MEADIARRFDAIERKLDERDGKLFDLLRIQAENVSNCKLIGKGERDKLDKDISGIGYRLDSHIRASDAGSERRWAVWLVAITALISSAVGAILQFFGIHRGGS